MDSLAERLRDRIRAEDGYSLVELLIVLAILGIVVGGLTQLFTSGANSEIDQNNRVQAQQQARVALDRLRREAHCASGVTFANQIGSTGTYATATLTLPSYCTRTTLTSDLSIGTSGLSGATIDVVTTNGFATGSNTISFGNSGYQTSVTCTGTTSTTFTGCSGGGEASSQTYSAGAVVTNTSSSTVTWCATGSGAPYTLTRYVSASCSGTSTSWSSSLVSNAVFTPYAMTAVSTSTSSSGGSLASGSYYYEVTPVLSSGIEVPGTLVGPVSISSGTSSKITLSWTAYTGAASYNVYGRDSSGVRLLANVTTTSYTDYGPATTTASVTLPAATIPVGSTQGFNSGANTIEFGASGAVSCTGITSTSFTGCTGGNSGTYASPATVYSYSTVRPPSTTLGVTFVIDQTPTTSQQRFTLSDNIVLRNSRPF